MNESVIKPHYETREFWGVYEYRETPDHPWKRVKDEQGNIIKVPKIPKLV